MYHRSLSISQTHLDYKAKQNYSQISLRTLEHDVQLKKKEK